MLMLLKSKSSVLLLTCDSFSSHEASEGERGGAEADTSPFGKKVGLGWEAGLKAKVSPSDKLCTQDCWRVLVLSNIPLSTISPHIASFSGEKGGEKAWLLSPKLTFLVSIKRSNGSLGQGAMGKEPSVALLLVEGIVNGAAVAFSSLFRTSGLMETAVRGKSCDTETGTRLSSG